MTDDLEKFKKFCESREFVPNEQQLEMVESMLSGKKIVLYARRIGKSTLYKHLKKFLKNDR